jgi:hypothetical protein
MTWSIRWIPSQNALLHFARRVGSLSWHRFPQAVVKERVGTCDGMCVCVGPSAGVDSETARSLEFERSTFNPIARGHRNPGSA